MPSWQSFSRRDAPPSDWCRGSLGGRGGISSSSLFRLRAKCQERSPLLRVSSAASLGCALCSGREEEKTKSDCQRVRLLRCLHSPPPPRPPLSALPTLNYYCQSTPPLPTIPRFPPSSSHATGVGVLVVVICRGTKDGQTRTGSPHAHLKIPASSASEPTHPAVQRVQSRRGRRV